MTSFTLADVRERTYKSRDAWWTVFLVDPLAARLVVWTANRTSITPNQITFGAGVLGAGSAVCFALGSWPWLVAGALLFHLSFVLDCMDGKIARLKGTGSVFGAWVDFVFDRIRFFGCMLALLIGQWAATGEVVYLVLAPVVTFLDLLRYLNGAQVAKTRQTMRQQLRAAAEGGAPAPAAADPESTETEPGAAGEPEAGGEGGGVVFVEEVLRENPELDAEQVHARSAETGARVIDVHQGFTRRFGWYSGLRAALLRSRVRPHLFSGIEFEMFVCVVAPLTALLSPAVPGATLIVPVAVLSCAALAAFEVLIVYKLWLATRDFAVELRRLQQAD
ncbi:CDP-alcohol phosphatidyltransferase family protein [Streptomonospora nanhaiensis]|uniref:Phosphatidylglycerophosphate synthase n=2 Tax=Streptomonospora nanhaiensis TaxID=1323731 RepID=A0A853BLA4_9ACTN|nr:CDP-alcohol phosphatidyltransferase family protein [Streptomonospora nanhaiensis]MBV2362156.1 CDP-alcohol phosphatidyltransferase family protein [Streptomonospora nanhaiensis]MBV2364772.1 CDP-alcohol phosphatidyltransferase family protein [Streptomonospora nanhaiensis]NYI96013.1 phosphatidylglycerophosphate synthase [Streptomonospora nanhaiensis]